MFWIVGYALITSWLVAVIFTPYLGVVLLPQFKKIDHVYEHIYATPRYNKFRRLVAWAVLHKFRVVGVVVGLFLLAGVGMITVKQQFFPNSDRPELLAEVQMPEGTSIETTDAVTTKVESWLRVQPESKIVTSYVGAGAPRFFIAYNPELPDPSFAKIIVLTENGQARDRLKERLRRRIAQGLAPEAKLRVSQLVFGPYQHFPVAFRVMGPDPDILRGIADRVQAVMRANPHTRHVNQDSGERAATLHFALDQRRLQLIGLSPAEAATQLQFLLTGVSVTQIREDIRTVDLVARGGGPERLDPAKIGNLTLTNRDGAPIPVSQIGRIEMRSEDPILRRRDRIPTITVQSDIDESLQPPQVSGEIEAALKPIIAKLPAGYRIETGGNIEDSLKANRALAPVFPIMLVLTLLVLVIQVRSLSDMFMVFLTSPLGLVGTVPILLLFHQPFGFNAILGLLGLSGILMRNTLILIGQIRTNRANGLDTYRAVVEATVQRARPVILTALAAVLAFIPLTQSVFWGSLAYTLIGGTAAGTALILLFLPALYSIWHRVEPTQEHAAQPPQAADPNHSDVVPFEFQRSSV
jgi:multidrug efflux pump subunit AcrB